MKKRAFDLFLALSGILLLAPLFHLVGLWIRVCDGSPVFFRQKRVGRGGVPFRMWKYRTMVPGGETRGGLLTVGDDARITAAGRILRRYKIDELPQLFNVLSGAMSFVGPRPEVPRYVALYTPEQRRVLEMMPGITDPASIRFRRESELLADAGDPEDYYVRVLLPEKIRLNLEYGRRATLSGDLRIILCTLFPGLLPGTP
ncbi:MAG TPA: sugar transferase [Syntrophales bacterium]|mgnify:FL=1|nr:sugar transferase [Syntrophales bacterium]HPX12695.1 sugar transferase [Syntrophales bacterium]HQB31328.1 sugar transferase [Syntrophales bacterium]HQN76925.1 sugar transferase [Syntrophales bacterium]HQQ26932.1 sugar transferase [Syntrophales bacterium]